MGALGAEVSQDNKEINYKRSRLYSQQVQSSSGGATYVAK